MRTRSVGLVTILLILAGALALNAKRPVTASLEVTPNPVAPGEALAVTSSLTNNTNEVQTATILLQMRGPCGVTASRGYKVLLNARQSENSKAAFVMPACTGGYQATLTISDHDGAILGVSTSSFEVAPKATASARGK